MRGAWDEGRTRLAACATGQVTGDGWRKVRLGEICSRVCSGGTPKSNNPLFYDGGEIPWLNTKEVNFESVYSTEKFITQAGYDNSAAKWVEPNSVIIAMYGATAGKSCINKIRLTTNQACCNMQIDDAQADYRYVYYLVRSRYNELASLAVGGAQQNLSAQFLKEYSVALPPLPIQRKIAEILGAYDDLIENNRRRIALLEKMARELYRERFVRRAGETYAKKTLGEIADITMGQSPDSSGYNTDGKGLPFHQGATGFGLRFPTNEMWSTEGKRYAQAGDILFSVRAPVGRINVSLEKIILGRGVSAMRQKEGFQSWLFYALKDHFCQEDMIGVGCVFASTTKDELYSVKLARPPDKVIKEFESASRPIDEEMLALTLQNRNLARQRDRLLPRLLSGRLEVRG